MQKEVCPVKEVINKGLEGTSQKPLAMLWVIDYSLESWEPLEVELL